MKTIVFTLFASIFLLSCSTNETSILDSYDCNDSAERIERLGKEVKLFSPILDAEFDLFNLNGFSDQRTLVPGASSSDYKFAVKINPDSANNWIAGMDQIDSTTTKNWSDKIIEKRKQNWIRTSKPEYYVRKNEDVLVILYRKEGIVFKRFVNL